MLVRYNRDLQVRFKIGMSITEPEMFDLQKIVLPKIQAYWKDVAYALCYKIEDVENLEAKHNKDPRKCCQDFFIDWLKTSHGDRAGSKTWSTLLNAIKDVVELTRAKEEIFKEILTLELKK